MRYTWKKFLIGGLALGMSVVVFAANPTIRIQGRLTDNTGAPITGANNLVKMTLNSALTGGTVLAQALGDDGTPGDVITVVTNDAGLFAHDVEFSPTSVFDSSADLFLEVSVQASGDYRPLSPRQKLSVVPFAIHAQTAATSSTTLSVADNSIGSNQIQPEAITSVHLASGAVNSDSIADGSVQVIDLAPEVKALTIPSGMIAMFAGPCPSGWTRFTDLDNRFPLGVATYTGIAGGSATISGLTTSLTGAHTHTVPHQHGAGTLSADGNKTAVFNASADDAHVAVNVSGHTHTISGQTASASPATTSNGDHTHKIISDGSWLPPYMGITFCSKD